MFEVPTKLLYERIKYLKTISSTNDINYLIDDNNLYMFYKKNPLRLKVCKLPKTFTSKKDVILINNPPMVLTDINTLLMTESVKLEIKDNQLYINDTYEEDAQFLQINVKNYKKFFFNFPLINNIQLKFICKRGIVTINGIEVIEQSTISDFTKVLDSEILSLFMERNAYIFETKHRIYLKNLNGDYLHLDYK